jgi:hypothetical protein
MEEWSIRKQACLPTIIATHAILYACSSSEAEQSVLRTILRNTNSVARSAAPIRAGEHNRTVA